MRALLVSGPDDLREALRGSTVSKLVTTAARLRPADPTTAVGATRFALRELARRVQRLEAQCERLDAVLEPLVAATKLARQRSPIAPIFDFLITLLGHCQISDCRRPLRSVHEPGAVQSYLLTGRGAAPISYCRATGQKVPEWRVAD